MRRMFSISLSAKERDYLIRVMRSEQAHWLRASECRAKGGSGGRSLEDHADYVLDATMRAEIADAMARHISTARKTGRMA